ncbi:MAG: hypothetical protein M3406_15455 [Chloroflexota bacterium]|nr:hypothetical protein [Chloroflexota bacterium]
MSEIYVEKRVQVAGPFETRQQAEEWVKQEHDFPAFLKEWREGWASRGHTPADGEEDALADLMGDHELFIEDYN